jgi:RNA polymerase-interacting CarD/CdnL/TRCF family regulator
MDRALKTHHMNTSQSLFPPSKRQLLREARDRQAKELAAAKKESRQRRKDLGTYSPRVGSQEWAETRGDDLGLSADY